MSISSLNSFRLLELILHWFPLYILEAEDIPTLTFSTYFRCRLDCFTVFCIYKCLRPTQLSYAHAHCGLTFKDISLKHTW